MGKYKFIGVLQARVGSSRLPGKMLLKICEESILQIILKRLRNAKQVQKWILATTNQKKDDKLVEIACKLAIPYFRGSESDVLDRLYQSAKQYNIKYMVRICGDNPLLDPKLIDDTIKEFTAHQEEFDYFSNHHPPTFPDGEEVEIIPFRSLKIAWKEATQPHEREHGTPFLWDQPKRFRIGNYECPLGNLYFNHRWTLDYYEDYEMIKAIFEELYPVKPDFSMEDIIKLLEKRPDISAINSMHRGKTWQLNEKERLATISQYLPIKTGKIRSDSRIK